MAKKDLTEIIVVLDRSGSMEHIKKDMEGGFNAFVEEQRREPGEARLTLVKFDEEVALEYAGVPLENVPPLSIVPRGWTALHDAIGMTIVKTGERLAALPEDDRPKRVLFVVITDGEENRSKEWNAARVKEAVQHQTEKYSWQFVYIGANQDSVLNAKDLGIPVAQNFTPDSGGVEVMTKNLSGSTRSYRGGGGYV